MTQQKTNTEFGEWNESPALIKPDMYSCERREGKIKLKRPPLRSRNSQSTVAAQHLSVSAGLLPSCSVGGARLGANDGDDITNDNGDGSTMD